MGKWNVSGAVVVTWAILGSSAMALGCGSAGESTDPVLVGTVDQTHLSGGSSGSGSGGGSGSSSGSGSSGGPGSGSGSGGGAPAPTCSGSFVTGSKPPEPVDCSSYDPTGNTWQLAEEWMDYLLATSEDANGDAPTEMSAGGAEGMSCFGGNTEGAWTYDTVFVPDSASPDPILTTKDFTLPVLITGNVCQCKLLTIKAGTNVNTLLSQGYPNGLAGVPPYMWAKNTGENDCTPPSGMSGYTGEPFGGNNHG